MPVIPRHTEAIFPISTYVGKGTSGWRAEPERVYEYMLVAAEEYAGGWRARTINAEEMPDWETGPDLSQYLAAWGADGWEALGMNIANAQMYILFKRGLTMASRTGSREASRGLPGLPR
jgi:hypothetical protein